MKHMRNTYRKISLDALLWALGGFAEPAPKPIDLRDRRLAELWRQGVPCAAIAEALGITVRNVVVRRGLLGLPSRYRPRKFAARKAAAFRALPASFRGLSDLNSLRGNDFDDGPLFEGDAP